MYLFASCQFQSKRRFLFALLLAALLMSGPGPVLRAQSAAGEGMRRVVSEVKPKYPPLAKEMRLRGVVRLEAVIAPDGKVKQVRVIGGHPLLAAEAEKATLQMKFEAAPRETSQIIEFSFEP